MIFYNNINIINNSLNQISWQFDIWSCYHHFPLFCKMKKILKMKTYLCLKIFHFHKLKKKEKKPQK
jgi:hypothetical protein